ncbi:hypothetical protein VNI00_017427 [Paramarasmius palmivorus]|uniref:Uncharacterized protein n=1 Tax=Paramarasmius palmivorus TaxID=297713 RepID=A0AAW0B7Q2_9AGAR
MALEEIASIRISSAYIEHPIAKYADGIPGNVMDITCIPAGNNTVWRLKSAESAEGIPEEVVFTIHGILVESDLPPVTRPFARHVVNLLHIESLSPRHAQQRITVTGLDTPAFNTAVHGLASVENFLRLNVRDESISQIGTTINGHHVIDISNRYFTGRRYADGTDREELSVEVDPNGFLAELQGEHFIHTSENRVEYYQRFTSPSGEHHFRKIAPVQIRNGDILEIQFTIVLIDKKIGKGRDMRQTFSVKYVLRSITLLNRTFSEHQRMTMLSTAKRLTLKRKVGHGDEEAKETQERMKRMAIDGVRQ